MKKQSTLEDGGTGGAGDTSGESAERDEVPPSLATTPKTTTADGESGSGTASTTTVTATTTIASESKEG